MGLSASQIRYLSLTARQTDIEYEAQCINSARLALANKSADANQAYTDGMSNKIIRIANGLEQGTGLKTWTELTFQNALDQGFQIMGGGGSSLVPSPYIEYAAGQEISADTYNSLPDSVKSQFASTEYDLNIKDNKSITLFYASNSEGGFNITDAEYQALYAGHKEQCSATVDGEGKHFVYSDIIFNNSVSPITKDQLDLLLKYTDLSEDEYQKRETPTYRATGFVRFLNPDYNGMDIQALLVSGKGQIVTSEFFNFLCEHGYGTGTYYNVVHHPDGTMTREATTYEALVEQFESTGRYNKTVVDWRSDVSNMFKEVLYTEDDAQVLAEYEAATAEIQAQDKKLELELKRLETEHKAIETELEAVKKVMEKNIENTYKTFG